MPASGQRRQLSFAVLEGGHHGGGGHGGQDRGPCMRVYEVPKEGVAALQPNLDAAQRRARPERLTDRVGLRREALTRDPHELEFAGAYFHQRASHDSTDGT